MLGTIWNHWTFRVLLIQILGYLEGFSDEIAGVRVEDRG
jgi:hypothetical protein